MSIKSNKFQLCYKIFPCYSAHNVPPPQHDGSSVQSDTFYEGKHARSLFKAEILLAAVTHFGTYLRMIKIHVCDVIIYFALKFEQRLSCQRQYDIIITVKSCIINAICNYICFQGSNLRLHSVGAEPNSMLTNDHSNHLYIRKEVYCKCCK